MVQSCGRKQQKYVSKNTIPSLYDVYYIVKIPVFAIKYYFNVYILTTQIKELENTKPFTNEKEFITLVRNCLQVKGEDRPSAASCVEAFKKLLLVGL